MPAVASNTIFSRTRWVVVRPQKGNFLFYNSRTDELHLVPPTGHAAYTLCDGIKTFGSIATELSEAIEVEPAVLQHHLANFLDALEFRGLLERADA